MNKIGLSHRKSQDVFYPELLDKQPLEGLIESTFKKEQKNAIYSRFAHQNIENICTFQLYTHKIKTLQVIDLQGFVDFYVIILCTRRDSNPYRWYRKPQFYPLNYGCMY